MDSLLDTFVPRHKEIFLDNFKEYDMTATEFKDKYVDELTEVEIIELFAHIKTWQTQSKIQNMLWNEAERLGDVYYLRKAGNWVGCDWYRAIVREEEKEYINHHKSMWEEKE